MAKSEEQTKSEYIDHVPTYHTDKQAQYVLPNGSPEHTRLETQARHLSAIMNGRIIHSPINKANVRRILDVGCGTGIVTDYLAREYTAAEAIGVDLSPVPTFRDRPSNVRFVQGNILTEKPSAWLSSGDSDSSREALPDTQAFDLIYSRLLICGLNDWPGYLHTSYSLLKPGGWAEVHDLDWIWYDKNDKVISEDWPWWRRLRSAGEARGLDITGGSRTQQWMKDAGFVDVQVTTYRWPFGGQWETDEVWREFGDYVSRVMVDMLWHLIPRLMEGQEGVTAEVIDRMREDMKRDFAPEEGKHWVFYVTCGRKPE
ncbi:hypothetical protein LTR36_008077 [Oleoguttula mirabilis]|uniref:Methyltransferase domain-containing protein n=1 Tax=Oleoguttula mirabilis TaxID=1507867 RepID=A0AAV9J8B5_9PEZI|nr:hypothetical protein LTR36_008077 [Oleoguttula mirabilis]